MDRLLALYARLCSGEARVAIEVFPESHSAEVWVLSGLDVSVNRRAVVPHVFEPCYQVVAEAMRSPSHTQEVAAASGLLLAVCPMHSTALRIHRECVEASGEWQQALYLVTALLGSTSAKTNKSPILWQWLRTVVRQLGAGVRPVVQQCVLLSGNRHPNNYYAWEFVRWWVCEHGDDWRDVVEGFCRLHPQDASAWSCLSRVCTGDCLELVDWVLEYGLNQASLVFVRVVARQPGVRAVVVAHGEKQARRFPEAHVYAYTKVVLVRGTYRAEGGEVDPRVAHLIEYRRLMQGMNRDGGGGAAGTATSAET